MTDYNQGMNHHMAKSDVFFGGEHNERLTCVSQDEYVLRYLEELDPADYPEVLEVFEFHRAQVPSTALRHHEPLELTLEYLDEEYGNHVDGGAFEPTERMKAAVEELKKVVIEEYVPWVCNQTGPAIEVTVKDWLEKHGGLED